MNERGWQDRNVWGFCLLSLPPMFFVIACLGNETPDVLVASIVGYITGVLFAAIFAKMVRQ